MREFTHVLTDPLGLHARLVVVLVAEARKWESDVTVLVRGSAASGDSLMGLMALDAMCGDELTVRVEGPDEGDAAPAIETVVETL